MAKPNRYFNVRFYFYIETDQQQGFSSINLETTAFPNEEYMMMIASAKIRKVFDLQKDEKIAISVQGWNEFRNQQDYLNFIKRRDYGPTKE